MLVKINSATPYGLEAQAISVEVNIASRGLPGFDIIGLPSKTVDESKHRIKTALINLKIDFPYNKKITVNLAPADIPKIGSFYDLPIAVGIICLLKAINPPSKSLFFGELSLDGDLRHTKGAFLLGLFAKEGSYDSVYVPMSNAREVSSIPGIKVFPVENFFQVYEHLLNIRKIKPFLGESFQAELSTEPNSGRKGDSVKLAEPKHLLGEYNSSAVDFSDIIGQESAKRSLELAAAGGHNFIMMGPPGVGKTLLSQAFCSILPPLSLKESLEVTKIFSAGGYIPPNGSLIRERPFRAPHHSISYAGMVGGGTIPRPGEISLAHRGVLFMDEFPEFPSNIIEMLRQPLESGYITISRGVGSFKFPCRFILLLALNPCPCGYFGHSKKECICSPGQIRRYRKKVSGPILDRVDLFTTLSSFGEGDYSFEKVNPFVEKKNTSSFACAETLTKRETSGEVSKRVIKARKIQEKRFEKFGIFCNSEMNNSQTLEFCNLDSAEKTFLDKAASCYGLSARAYFKTIKISRTIADLEGEDRILKEHLAEALQHRVRDFD
ncbi:YifB family Mg chelatase-like AAA ATPase [Patescibacteria group bacterium]|nr:YifB family Mg chelatase-like AAA ATPase [Patescibacteria group bacterium]